jgi:hypothetical protein
MGSDWKSTASGVLSFLITTLTTISAFLVAGNINSGGASTSSIHVSTWVVVGVNAGLALCRAWVGLITTNADAGAVAKVLAPLVPSTPVMTSTPMTTTVTTPSIPTAASLAATPKTP